MVFLEFKDFAVVAGVISGIASLISGAYIMYSSRSKTHYNELTRRVELEAMRKSFEEKIYDLTQRMQKNPDRWRDVNHLVVEGTIYGTEQDFNYGESVAPLIKPYQFIEDLGIDSSALKVIKNQVFVLTPFHSIYDETYNTIKSACAMNNLTAVRGDEAFKVGNILKHIIEQIICSSFVVANINGRNPNVHYELGIAHALGKNVLLVSEGAEDISFDLQSERVLIYKSQKDLSNKIYIYYAKTLKQKRSMDMYHIILASGGWELKMVGSEQATMCYASKKELIDQLSTYFRGKTASVKIHKSDGTIQEERNYRSARASEI